MAVRQYIGARYVPIFDGAWDNTKEYEPLVIVEDQGNSYTSKTYVPVGVDINNTTYWACTGNYNAQVEYYRQEVLAYANDVGQLADLGTTDKDSIVDAINEVLGDVGNNATAISDLSDGLSDVVDDVADLQYNERFKNKNILIIGDSISDEALYPNCWVKDFRPMVEAAGGTVTNISLQGRTIVTIDDETNNLNTRVQSVTGDYDYIIVFLGVNDWSRQTPLGQFMTDNTAATIAGSLRVFNTWKRTNYPNAEVIIMPPLKSKKTDFTGHKLLQMYKMAICSAGMYFGWTVIDTHSYAPLINPNVSTDFSIDGIHVTDAYGPFLARFVYDNVSKGTSMVGFGAMTQLGIGDVNGVSNRVITTISEDGALTISVADFPITSQGSVKLAEFPEECLPNGSPQGVGVVTQGDGTTVVVWLIFVSGALYASIPTGVTGSLRGHLSRDSVRYITNLRSLSY